VVIGPGADGSSPNKFGGANDPNAKPSIVYPPDGVVVPANMNSLEIHFVPAPGQTLFEIKFQAPTKALAIYTTCTPVGAGCVYQTDASFWSNLVGYARGTAPVTYTIRGVNGSSPGSVGTSATASIAFGEHDIGGGIYYWNAQFGNIQRYDFGIPNVPAKLYMNKFEAGANICLGCHVMSRQGNRILVGLDIPGPSKYKLFDVATKMPAQLNGQPFTGLSNFFSFSPNEQYFLQSNGFDIAMRRISDGTIVVAKVVNSGTMPDWSPDGLTMAYARPQTPTFGAQGVSSASIDTMHWNGTTWDTPKALVPFAGQNNYYPTYDPTGDWVLFNRSPSNKESATNAQAGGDGELWVVASNGGTPIRLTTASSPGATSWPKWAPVRHDYYGGQILWATFSSPRAYGLRLAAGQQTQIWMMGFDLQKAAAGQDPSLPAFWFPYQSTLSSNHIAQWATTIARQPCTSDTQCSGGEVCKNEICQPVP
jgi:hypothetical protein